MTRMAGNDEAALRAAIDAIQEGPGWVDRNRQIPGNTYVFPNQPTEHSSPTGSLNWQYPFFRADLVKAGLLPAQAPPGSPRDITLPPGMSVMDAIRTGVLR